MGAVSALGWGVDAQLDALRSQRSGVGKMRYLGSVHTEIPVAEVPMSIDEMARAIGIDPDVRHTRTALMGALALKESLQQAGLENPQNRHIALVSGTTVGGMDKSEAYYKEFLETDSNTCFINTQDCGTTTEFAAECMPVFDFATTISTACSSAANAIIFAANLIKTGRYDIVAAGGSECISKFHLNGFNSLFILDKEPCRPYDASRAGLNLGEGAGYIILESEESALRRGVEPLCELKGYGNACDAFHQTASSPDGRGAYLAMQKALKMSGLSTGDIDYINAHGTGTPNNDQSEGTAIDRLFGAGKVPPVSSTKSYTGHTTSASGGIEAVISILAIRNNFLPVNLHFKTRIEGLSFDPVTDSTPSRPVRNVISNSFGFGGNDTSIIFSAL